MSEYDPADLMLHILEKTQGQWELDDVLAIYEYIQGEYSANQAAKLTLVTGLEH